MRRGSPDTSLKDAYFCMTTYAAPQESAYGTELTSGRPTQR